MCVNDCPCLVERNRDESGINDRILWVLRWPRTTKKNCSLGVRADILEVSTKGVKCAVKTQDRGLSEG